MRSSIRLILAMFMLAGTALAAPAADPNAPEANDEVSAKASEMRAKAASKADEGEETVPQEEASAAPAPAETPAPGSQEAASQAESAPAPAAAEPEAAAAPDWWGPIRDATNAEIDKSAGAASVTGASSVAPPPASTGANLWRGLSALLIVLALIVACYAALIRIRRHAPMLAGGEFATVVGRLSLDSRFALHFVRVGEKVLLLGVTPQNINILEVFDAASFQRGSDEGAPEVEPHQDFLAHLRASGAALNPLAPGAADDEEIVSLRGDIERLKRYLEEGPRVDPEQ